MSNVKIKTLGPNVVVPVRMSDGAAAYDVLLPEDVYIKPGRNKIGLGFALEIPDGMEAKIEPRSGFSCNGMVDSYGQRFDADVLVGKIDSDYRGEVSVIIKSCERYNRMMLEGTRVAQMTFYKVESVQFLEVDELTKTERGNGGFGSTGTGAGA